MGGFALGWNGAAGGVAIARHFAEGGYAHAAQANNAAVTQYLQSSAPFQFAIFVNHHFFVTTLIWVVPMFIQWRALAKARRGR